MRAGARALAARRARPGWRAARRWARARPARRARSEGGRIGEGGGEAAEGEVDGEEGVGVEVDAEGVFAAEEELDEADGVEAEGAADEGEVGREGDAGRGGAGDGADELEEGCGEIHAARVAEAGGAVSEPRERRAGARGEVGLLKRRRESVDTARELRYQTLRLRARSLRV